MRLLKLKDIKFERRGGVRYVDGDIIQDDPKTLTIKGNLQPERNLSLIRETFGSHVAGAIKIYSPERLRTQESDGDADVVLYDGRRWEVSDVRHYDDLIPHFKIIAILMKDEK